MKHATLIASWIFTFLYIFITGATAIALIVLKVVGFEILKANNGKIDPSIVKYFAITIPCLLLPLIARVIGWIGMIKQHVWAWKLLNYIIWFSFICIPLTWILSAANLNALLTASLAISRQILFRLVPIAIVEMIILQTDKPSGWGNAEVKDTPTRIVET